MLTAPVRRDPLAFTPMDPVYTGKAMHGLRTMVAEGSIERSARVLFMHCGGSPALYPFASELSSG